MTLFGSAAWLVPLAVVVCLGLALGLWLTGLRVIHADQSGLVIKKYGPALAANRIIALDGEAGYQARMLSPGWHTGYWRWRYTVVRVPVTTVEAGQIALVVAADGASIAPERVLGRAVACDNFQDAEAFLRNGGERGRQLAVLTAGTYRINPSLFDVVRSESAEQVLDGTGGSAGLPDAAGPRRHRDRARRPSDSGRRSRRADGGRP